MKSMTVERERKRKLEGRRLVEATAKSVSFDALELPAVKNFKLSMRQN